MELKPHEKGIGLSLSGGAALGIAHIGVLRALEEKNIPIKYIAGTSVGAIIATLYAFGVSLEQMTNATSGLSWRQLSRFAYSKLGIASNQPIADLVTNIIGNVRIEEAKIPLAIVATNITRGEIVTLTSGNIAQAIRASTSIPGIYTPIEINSEMYVDGGLIENLPLSPLKKCGASVIVGVNLIGRSAQFKPKNIFDVFNVSLDILMRHRDKELLKKIDVLIEPHLENFSGNRFENPQRLIDEGYRATIAAIPGIQRRLHRHPFRHLRHLQRALSPVKIVKALQSLIPVPAKKKAK